MVLLVNRHDGLAGVVFLVCLARVVFAGGVDRPRDVFAIRAFADDDENVVHLTSAVVDRDQHVSTPAATKPFAWGVSSETACAIWSLLDPKWVSVITVIRLGVVRGCVPATARTYWQGYA